MQDRYVGDTGDYVKLAILRALSPGKRLGMAWWLFPDSGCAGDGRHISYLNNPDKWRHLDPTVFDALKEIVDSKKRQVSALEDSELLPNSVHFSEVIPSGAKAIETRMQREDWLARCRAHLAACNLVFVDPDNGLATKDFSLGAYKAGKSVSLPALTALRQVGRTLIVYHHHTRYKGGNEAELRYWAARLRDQGFERVDALRANPYSTRAFFLLEADDEMRSRAKALAGRWGGRISWYPECIHPQWHGKSDDIQFMNPEVVTMSNHPTPAGMADNTENDAAVSKARSADMDSLG